MATATIDRRKQTTIEEIEALLKGRKRGLTAADIAAKLNRKVTTVQRELAYGGFSVVGQVRTGGAGRPANLYL